MNMKDWVVFLDKFLELSDYPLLLHKGKNYPRDGSGFNKNLSTIYQCFYIHKFDSLFVLNLVQIEL